MVILLSWLWPTGYYVLPILWHSSRRKLSSHMGVLEIRSGKIASPEIALHHSCMKKNRFGEITVPHVGTCEVCFFEYALSKDGPLEIGSLETSICEVVALENGLPALCSIGSTPQAMLHQNLGPSLFSLLSKLIFGNGHLS